MRGLNVIQNVLVQGIGLKTAAASTSGNANARAAALLPLAIGSGSLMSSYSTTATGVLVTSVAVASSSGWTLVLSSGNLAAHALVGIRPFQGQSALTAGILQIASGAAGSEIPVAGCWADGTGVREQVLVAPPVQWPTNERVSARVLSGTTGQSFRINVNFQARPL